MNKSFIKTHWSVCDDREMNNPEPFPRRKVSQNAVPFFAAYTNIVSEPKINDLFIYLCFSFLL